MIVAVNKADNEKRELEGAEFHRFGWDETYPISALHGRGAADLLDAIVWALPPESEAEVERKRTEAEADELAELEASWSRPPATRRLLGRTRTRRCGGARRRAARARRRGSPSWAGPTSASARC